MLFWQIFWQCSVWIETVQLYQDLKHKVLQSYSQALPIHARTGREWGPENACSLTDFRMTSFRSG
jgi:hypothetical protein